MNDLLIPDYWLTGLGSWAVSYLLHSTVILGLVLLLTHFARFISESRKDVLLKMGLVAGILTASIQFVQSSAGAFSSTIVLDIAAASDKVATQPNTIGRTLTTDNLIFMTTPESDALVGPDGSGQRMTINWLNGLLIAWLVGVVFFSARFVYLWQQFKRSIGAQQMLEHQPTIALCQQLKDKMSIKRPITLTQSSLITSPMALGLSQICIPKGLWLQVDEEQLTAIIAHELAHISRTDPIWLFFWHLMSIVFFFQPLNKLTQLSFQSRAEFLADATAVRQTKDPVAMVNSLMSAAKLASQSSITTLATHLLGRNATIVERSRLLLSENLVKTSASVSFILLAAMAIVVSSASLLPSISLASKPASNIMTDQLKLTTDNSAIWDHYVDNALTFQTYLNYRESIAGKQIELKTKRVTFDHQLDGIAAIGPFGELRFVSRSIYTTKILVITSDLKGNARYQYTVDDKVINDQRAATKFIQQALDEGLGQSDEFKRRMLPMYAAPLSVKGPNNAQQLTLNQLNRVLDNQQGFYSNEDFAIVYAIMDNPDLFGGKMLTEQHTEGQWQEQARFFNAMAHSGPYVAFFNDFGYLNISHKQSNNVRVGAQYDLNNPRFLDLFIKATGRLYIEGVTEKAMVRFLVRLHFDVAPDEIKWLEE